MPLRSISDPAGQSGTEEKREIKWYHYIYLIQRLQCETAIPSACGRRTPIHSRNPVFFSLLCVVPPFLFLVPCWNRGSIQASLSLILLCQLTPVFMPWMMEIKKKEIQNKERTHAHRINFPPLPLSSSCAHTRWNRRMRGDVRVAAMYMFCSVALHLFFLLLSLPPFLLLSTSLCLSLSLSFSVRGLLVHTEAGCSVVTGETALRVQRHLWMCLCWGTKVAS